MLAAVLVGAGVGTTLFVGGVGRAGIEAEPAPVRWVAVEPGDTLWTIAEEVAPGTDPRDLIVHIRQLNDLDDSRLRPGQRLAVPASRPPW